MNSFEQNEEKIKADVNAVIQSVGTGQPDVERLKEAGSDILSTAAALLSDSGIDGLREKLGLDGNALDGLRKAADELKNKL